MTKRVGTWVFSFNNDHWNGARGGGCCHGPRSMSWPWWKPFAFLWCNITVNPEAPGRRLWFYSRRGACHLDVWIDRRDVMRRLLP